MSKLGGVGTLFKKHGFNVAIALGAIAIVYPPAPRAVLDILGGAAPTEDSAGAETSDESLDDAATDDAATDGAATDDAATDDAATDDAGTPAEPTPEPEPTPTPEPTPEPTAEPLPEPEPELEPEPEPEPEPTPEEPEEPETPPQGSVERPTGIERRALLATIDQDCVERAGRGAAVYVVEGSVDDPEERFEFRGTSGNDVIVVTAGATSILGGGGDDCIIGGEGEDWITGGSGRDVIVSAGGGADIVLSSPGRDRILADDSDIVPAAETRHNCTIADTGEPCHPDESETETDEP
ncbi:MAG: hypothetical protein ACE367_07815 [Acidimicrobiales bacterium]